MEFSSRQFADVTVAAPVGRLDHPAARAFEAALAPLVDRAAAAGVGLVLDFGGVEYISSVGLRVLMVAAKQMRARGARIAVAALQPLVGEIFAISRFDAVLDVRPTLRDAIGSVSGAALAAFDAVGAAGRR